MTDERHIPPSIGEQPGPAPDNILIRGTPVDDVAGQPDRNGISSPLPQVMELIMTLVLLALVAWTCYLLYAPQLRFMFHFLFSRK